MNGGKFWVGNTVPEIRTLNIRTGGCATGRAVLSDFSLLRLGFAMKTVYVVWWAHRGSLNEVSVREIRFYPVSVVPPTPHSN